MYNGRSDYRGRNPGLRFTLRSRHHGRSRTRIAQPGRTPSLTRHPRSALSVRRNPSFRIKAGKRNRGGQMPATPAWEMPTLLFGPGRSGDLRCSASMRSTADPSHRGPASDRRVDSDLARAARAPALQAIHRRHGRARWPEGGRISNAFSMSRASPIGDRKVVSLQRRTDV
jgi:hypothetical protein